jgi:lipoprotein-anchoring transpeptidase ErfK/SrfK
MHKRTVVLLLIACAATPSAALADGTPPPPPPPPTPTPTPPPPVPPPPAAKISLQLAKLLRSGKTELALTGQSVSVHGTISPYVAGEQVTVRAQRGHKKLLVRAMAVHPVAGTTDGQFNFRVKSAKPGRLAVRASHLATANLGTGVAKTVHVRVLRPQASFGSRGPVVDLVQAGLARLHYAISRSGRYDDSTGRAVLAYRKVNHLARVEAIDRQILLRLIRGVGTFKPRYPSQGRHVEADLSRQVLVELNGDTPYRIYHMSSGKPSTPTVLGTFHVYSKTPGVNAKLMFDSNYFIGGYAIHGYPDVPPYAASHGCLRIPNADAPSVFAWVRVGTTVDVYR